MSQASRSSSSRSRFTGHSKHANRFQALLADKLIREYISPLVDHGGMLVDSVAQALFHLIRCLTQHKHIADANKLDPKSAICMMFGEKTAGLRQLAVRAIIKQVTLIQIEVIFSFVYFFNKSRPYLMVYLKLHVLSYKTHQKILDLNVTQW